MNLQRNEALLVKVGARIRELREKRGLSMDQFCAEAGMEKSQIHRIETGKYNTTISTLYTISEVLGIKIDELMKGVY